MTDQLLPPDPSKDGWYWLSHSSKPPQVWEWCVDGAEGSWRRDSADGSGREMALWGYSLASPHPIPTPEQLNALHALPAGIDRRNSRIQAELANYQKATVDEPYARAKGRMSGFKMCAAMLRAALGAKPDDPPGNGLGDIRAAAMDQWGVPRAGEGTAP